MGNIANQALAKARASLTPKKSLRRPAPRVEKVATPPESAVGVRQEITGPINKVMYREGRAWALDLVKSLRASPVDIVIERLSGAAVGRPGSYASGINSVIAALLQAHTPDLAIAENLTRHRSDHGSSRKTARG
ncbi:hypothetical protein [Pseudomonas sp. RIT-To-2]|uniref:hypothetical protein n=1 Tax=Pseudomonas sp. RIT-To-2 TaxID=3462541 RepID=UPI00241369D2